MASENRDRLNRRRSSVAYDPARDTFKEIPSSIPENAVVDDDSRAGDNSAVTSSSPARDKGPSVSRKRVRSPSPVRRTPDPVKRSRADDEGSGNQKQHDSPGQRSNHDGRGAAGDPNSRPISSRPMSDLPRIPRKTREEGEHAPIRSPPSAYKRRPDGDRDRDRDRYQRNGNASRRSRSPSHRQRSPASAYRRRSPPRTRDERPRSPSPIRASPPREPQIRPGGARGRGRNVLAEQQRLAAERERQAAATTNNLSSNPSRGVQDVSNQFYNQRPEWVRERGRDWRKNESQIKGLRSFNNWIKSCLIQKFSAEEKSIGEEEELGWGEEAKPPEEKKPLLVLDVGCGKGGDLGKWQLAPQPVALYVGLDPAATSIRQANERYQQMRRGRRPIFDARFIAQDCFGEWIGNVGIVREVGIDPNAGQTQNNRWTSGGFDIVAAMFTMHYSFESEEKVKMMLKNVAGSLKKGGRFLGVAPNSDVLSDRVQEWFGKKNKASGSGSSRIPPVNGSSSQDTIDPAPNSSRTPTTENKTDDDDDDNIPSWGNEIYKVRFPHDPARPLNPETLFRPPFGWKYTYWMAEAVDVPEFVVPWEAFRAMAVSFGLEQRYRKPFLELWESEKHDPEMSSLAVRMGVTKFEGGELVMSPEEKEAVAFYHGFCFVKV